MIAAVGSHGIRRRKPVHRLEKLRGAEAEIIDEPPVMWSPPGSGFVASSFSPAGYVQGIWRMTGRGSDAREAEAGRRQRRIPGRVGLFLLHLLGYRGQAARGLLRARTRARRGPHKGAHRYRGADEL